MIDRLQRRANDCLRAERLVGSRYSGAGAVDGQFRVVRMELSVYQGRKAYLEEVELLESDD